MSPTGRKDVLSLKIPDIIAGILGIVIAVYVIFTAHFFPEDKVLLLGLAFFSLLLLTSALRGRSRPANDPFDIKTPGVQRACVSLAASVAYCALFSTLGFILTSVIYLFALMYLLKRRDYLKMAAVSIGVTLLVYGIFNKLLDISLPAGFLG